MDFAVKTSDAWKINPLVMRPASAQPIFRFFFAASFFDVKTAVFPSLVMRTELFISTLEQAVHCFDPSVIYLCSSPVWILVNHGDCHCVNSDVAPVHVQLCKYFHILMQIPDKHLRKPSPYTLWLCLLAAWRGVWIGFSLVFIYAWVDCYVVCFEETTQNLNALSAVYFWKPIPLCLF